ncbi:MAG: sporulation transcriptional regulator SpoIIID [Clostridia bacterium]|nr:sporulation transcriptional regulator SpoIIID [Clostridia bacterium]
MRQEIQDRCMLLGRYIARTGATVRQAAERFGMSKSSVHKDVHERLRAIHPGLYAEVRDILDYHHAVRHLRGGAATRLRWRMIRQKNQIAVTGKPLPPGNPRS